MNSMANCKKKEGMIEWFLQAHFIQDSLLQQVGLQKVDSDPGPCVAPSAVAPGPRGGTDWYFYPSAPGPWHIHQSMTRFHSQRQI